MHYCQSLWITLRPGILKYLLSFSRFLSRSPARRDATRQVPRLHKRRWLCPCELIPPSPTLYRRSTTITTARSKQSACLDASERAYVAVSADRCCTVHGASDHIAVAGLGFSALFAQHPNGVLLSLQQS